jgi:hypothetical protein
MRYSILIFVLILFLVSCQDSKREVRLLLDKGKKEDLVKAFYQIGETRDTSFLKEVIANPYDPRVVHVAEFYGISVYQSKMIALKKISGLTPPKKITYQPDSTVINFYCRWINRNTSVRCGEKSVKNH